jgi:AraC-like DNA-binding protein
VKAAADLLLTECAGLPGCAEDERSTGIAWQRWQAARHYVDEHLQEPIDRKTVAAALSLHPNHLSRLFTRFHDKNFSQYVLHARMARADLLLADDRLNISDVAYLCGFSTPNYFTRLYTLLHGMPPGKRRARGL